MDIAAPIEIMWKSGAWTALPVAAEESGGRLLVTAAEGSDAWRHTGYGFVHEDEHALLEGWDRGRAVEVSFIASFEAQFDQAGLMVRVDAERWIKAGVEFADGAPQVGAVVTAGKSDWSVAPVPEWAGREVTIRASRFEDAVIIRARVEDEPWRLVRLAPLDPEAEVQAGPYCCAPSRAGLTVAFTSWRLTEPDAALH
jgi:regulation of enolase protein 1 (concanavalin A-like superfamily)